MSETKFTCEKKVLSGSTWHLTYRLCGRPAKVEENGKHYCGIHDPELGRKRAAKSYEAYNEILRKRTLVFHAEEMYEALKAANCIHAPLKKRGAALLAMYGTPSPRRRDAHD